MLNWFRNHKLLMIVASVILVFCIIILISYTRGNLGIVSSGVQTANSVVQKPLTQVVGRFQKDAEGLIGFRSVVKENEELRDEIAKLKNENIRLKLQQEELEELRNLYAALNYVPSGSEYTGVAANIIAIDGAHYFNIFTIDRGTESGIEKDAIVLSGEGLVGKVIDSGNGFSKVVSIIDTDSNVAFMVLRDMNVMGIVSGNGNGMMSGYTFEGDAEINEGDTLITSGIGLYPVGIEIGTVRSINFNKDTQLKTIEVEPLVVFNSLKKVMVLL